MLRILKFIKTFVYALKNIEKKLKKLKITIYTSANFSIKKRIPTHSKTIKVIYIVKERNFIWRQPNQNGEMR